MGTNYYVKSRPPCECCGREYEGLHIGKSSGGWKFLFAPYPENGLTSMKKWFLFLRNTGAEIIDEYNETVHLDDLFDLVESKQRPENLDSKNASKLQWGSGMEGRDRYETFDEDGYRFSTDPDFS